MRARHMANLAPDERGRALRVADAPVPTRHPGAVGAQIRSTASATSRSIGANSSPTRLNASAAQRRATPGTGPEVALKRTRHHADRGGASGLAAPSPIRRDYATEAGSF